MAAKKKAEKPKVGCTRPGGKVIEQKTEKSEQTYEEVVQEVKAMIKVGKPAPDFIAPAYHKGEFTSVKLSDYRGKWVVLCLYPGDFTFV
jgi:hypothetical protein